MNDARVCPNEGFVKDAFSYTEILRDTIVPGLDSAIEIAADANRLATIDPLRVFDLPMSLEEVTDMAVMWSAYAERIKELADRAGGIINSPCPGAQACVKMVVSMEAADTIREMAKPFMEE